MVTSALLAVQKYSFWIYKDQRIVKYTRRDHRDLTKSRCR